MSEAPIMPLATDAYVADTMHLTTEEHGAYLLLLIATWRNNGAPLPDDDKRLGRIARATPARWKRLRPVLEEFFDISADGWRQKRLEKEWRYVSQRLEIKRANGRKGGRPKSLNNNKPDKPIGSVSDSLNESTHTHTHTHKEKNNKNDDDSGFKKFWEAYPLSVGEHDAKKEFEKAIEVVDLETLLAGVARYRAGKPDIAEWAYPASWLKKGRWSDVFDVDVGPTPEKIAADQAEGNEHKLRMAVNRARDGLTRAETHNFADKDDFKTKLANAEAALSELLNKEKPGELKDIPKFLKRTEGAAA
jgi:uncharacterized protein YdaU (DUF1376 family)